MILYASDACNMNPQNPLPTWFWCAVTNAVTETHHVVLEKGAWHY